MVSKEEVKNIQISKWEPPEITAAETILTICLWEPEKYDICLSIVPKR
jgi:hypothetical protein